MLHVVRNLALFNGVIITNRYDVINRLTTRVYPDGTSDAFTYTATGQRQNCQARSPS